MASRINLLTRFSKKAITQNRTAETTTTTVTSGAIQWLTRTAEENDNLLAENKKLLVDNENLRVRDHELKREVEEAYRQLWSREIEGDLRPLLQIIPTNSQARLLHLLNQHPKSQALLLAFTMEAAAETQNDLINLLNEKNVFLTETKAEAAQSASAVNKIIEENIQLKDENERLQAEIKELRIKLFDATQEERKMNARRLHDVLKIL